MCFRVNSGGVSIRLATFAGPVQFAAGRTGPAGR